MYRPDEHWENVRKWRERKEIAIEVLILAAFILIGVFLGMMWQYHRDRPLREIVEQCISEKVAQIEAMPRPTEKQLQAARKNVKAMGGWRAHK